MATNGHMTIEQMKAVAIDRRARLVQEAEQDYEKTMHAIEIISDLSSMNGHAPPAPKQVSRKRSKKTYGTLMRSIEKIVTNRKRRYTTRDVRDRLKDLGKKHPQTSVNSALTRLVDKGVIKVVRKGSGKRPSLLETIA